MKSALITGATGQDGGYVAELLLEKGYHVYCMVRRISTPNMIHLKPILDKITIVPGDLTDQSSINEAVRTANPDILINAGAQSFVPASWNQPILTADVTGLGVTRVLEAIRKIKPDTRMIQFSSSEMFGKVIETPQTENTPFYPRSPYGVAKCYGYYITKNYRESYGLHASNGIFFNHESPRRGEEFVSRKITMAVARIKAGLQKELLLGDIDAKRDWGYARDYMKAALLILEQDTPDDYIIGTGETHSVREFCDLAFATVGLHYLDYLRIDPSLIRPAEVKILLANPAKAREKLGWTSTTNFQTLVQMMVNHDIKILEDHHD